MSKKKTNGLALYDPRFASFTVPDLKDEMDYLKDTTRNLEAEALELHQRVGALSVLEALKKAVSFKCARNFDDITIVACKYQRRRSSCHCDALKSWITRYIMDD